MEQQAAQQIATDMRGTGLTFGSKVVYPRRSGSNMWMVEAEVEGVAENGRLRVKRLSESGYGGGMIAVNSGNLRTQVDAANVVAVQ